MKRLLIIFSLIALLGSASNALAETAISIGSARGEVGMTEAMLPLLLKNDQPVAGIQFRVADDLAILQLDTVLTTGRTAGFTVMFNEDKVIVFDLSGRSISAGDSTVLNLYFRVGSLSEAVVDSVRFAAEPILATPEGEKMVDVIAGTGVLNIMYPTGIVDEKSAMPQSYALEQNYPNPFNPSTTIRFALKDAGNVRLVVYNALGKEVALLINKRMKPGYHTVNFDAGKFSSGIYFYELIVNNFKMVRKMLLMR